MLIVVGSIVARPEHFTSMREAAAEHVARSRGEPGCISHAMYLDPEDPLRLFFFEEWESRPHLDAHFATPGAATFLAAVQAYAAGRPEIRVHVVGPPPSAAPAT